MLIGDLLEARGERLPLSALAVSGIGEPGPVTRIAASLVLGVDHRPELAHLTSRRSHIRCLVSKVRARSTRRICEAQPPLRTLNTRRSESWIGMPRFSNREAP